MTHGVNHRLNASKGLEDLVGDNLISKVKLQKANSYVNCESWETYIVGREYILT